MTGYRLAIFATAVCERPAASPTVRRDAPSATAARMRSSRRSVHSRAFCEALATAERSVIGRDGLTGGEVGLDVDEALEALLRLAPLDLSLAVLANALGVPCHAPTVNLGSTPVNKVAA